MLLAPLRVRSYDHHIFRGSDRGSGRLSKLPRVMHWVSGGSMIYTELQNLLAEVTLWL